MALPSSGQISFDNVRTETSQSSLTSYAFSKWASGYNNYYTSTGVYAPINYISSGSRWSASTTMSLSNLSMSAWYSYDHSQRISQSVTGTLQTHFSYYASGIIPSTMLIVEVGTTNQTYSINISGSNSPYGDAIMYVFYGKPWEISGVSSGSIATKITGALYGAQNMSFDYNYTYDSNKGDRLYFVILPDPT